QRKPVPSYQPDPLLFSARALLSELRRVLRCTARGESRGPKTTTGYPTIKPATRHATDDDRAPVFPKGSIPEVPMELLRSNKNILAFDGYHIFDPGPDLMGINRLSYTHNFDSGLSIHTAFQTIESANTSLSKSSLGLGYLRGAVETTLTIFLYTGDYFDPAAREWSQVSSGHGEIRARLGNPSGRQFSFGLSVNPQMPYRFAGFHLGAETPLGITRASLTFDLTRYLIHLPEGAEGHPCVGFYLADRLPVPWPTAPGQLSLTVRVGLSSRCADPSDERTSFAAGAGLRYQW
ncbi:hypothetical protein KKF84_15895, partial [Myxococcota bacterium]|nr:hypothetical protein [Myxococcota bacterium]